MTDATPGQADDVEVPADGAIVARTGCDGGVLILALGPGVDLDRATETAHKLHHASGLKVIAVADVAAVRGWHPHDAPAELAAAMAETRAVRDGYAALCGEFGPSAQSGWSARIPLTTLNRHRAAAGLDRFSRTESNQREDITMRYRRERDDAREQAEQMELERDEARHRLATCRERNAAIAVQLDQYRDERDNALALAAEILAAYESGTVVSGELLGIWRERLGTPEHPEGMIGNPRPIRSAHGQWTLSGYDEKGFACLDEDCPACSAQALIINEENAAECLTCAWRESASTEGGVMDTAP